MVTLLKSKWVVVLLLLSSFFKRKSAQIKPVEKPWLQQILETESKNFHSWKFSWAHKGIYRLEEIRDGLEQREDSWSWNSTANRHRKADLEKCFNTGIGCRNLSRKTKPVFQRSSRGCYFYKQGEFLELVELLSKYDSVLGKHYTNECTWKDVWWYRTGRWREVGDSSQSFSSDTLQGISSEWSGDTTELVYIQKRRDLIG